MAKKKKDACNRRRISEALSSESCSRYSVYLIENKMSVEEAKILGKDAERVVAQIRMSDDVIKNGIVDMRHDILEQVTDDIKESLVKILLQLDESGDIAHYCGPICE